MLKRMSALGPKAPVDFTLTESPDRLLSDPLKTRASLSKAWLTSSALGQELRSLVSPQSGYLTQA
jgi:hypothetical protein